MRESGLASLTRCDMDNLAVSAFGKLYHHTLPMFNDVHSLNFQNSSLSQVQGDQHNNFVTNVVPNDAQTALGLLKPVARDGYQVPRCMEGTRESVFKEIINWSNGTHIPSFVDVVLD